MAPATPHQLAEHAALIFACLNLTYSLLPADRRPQPAPKHHPQPSVSAGTAYLPKLTPSVHLQELWGIRMAHRHPPPAGRACCRPCLGWSISSAAFLFWWMRTHTPSTSSSPPCCSSWTGAPLSPATWSVSACLVMVKKIQECVLAVWLHSRVCGLSWPYWWTRTHMPTTSSSLPCCSSWTGGAFAFSTIFVTMMMTVTVSMTSLQACAAEKPLPYSPDPMLTCSVVSNLAWCGCPQAGSWWHPLDCSTRHLSNAPQQRLAISHPGLLSILPVLATSGTCQQCYDAEVPYCWLMNCASSLMSTND